MKDEIVVVSAVRTPFGRFGGSLRDIDCYDLGAMVMKEVLERVNLSGAVDEVFWGVGDTSCCKDPFTPVVARQALLKAGLPPETPSCSLDKACVSAMSAANYGCRTIRAGEGEVILAGGVTSFSTVPFLLRNQRFHGRRLGHVTLEDPLLGLGYKDYAPVAKDAGEVAVKHGIAREEQDAWAVRSHQRYGEAYAAGKFHDEIMPLEVLQKDGSVKVFLDIDEQYRPGVSVEQLAKLKPIYGSPTCTAGNAPGLNDGAAALLITTREKARELGVEPLATIVNMVSIATKPMLLAEGPAIAISKSLARANLGIDNIDLIEINEAFAAVTLVSTKMLAGSDVAKYRAMQEKVNVNGGAIAVGHANTASGARIMMTLIYELRRRGGGIGVAALCGGLAQGDAALIRVG